MQEITHMLRMAVNSDNRLDLLCTNPVPKTIGGRVYQRVITGHPK